MFFWLGARLYDGGGPRAWAIVASGDVAGGSDLLKSVAAFLADLSRLAARYALPGGLRSGFAAGSGGGAERGIGAETNPELRSRMVGSSFAARHWLRYESFAGRRIDRSHVHAKSGP